MKAFEWRGARDLREGPGEGAVTVAAAMTSRSGRPAADAVVLKAGGIDLLDLMKEGLLAPRRVVNLRTLAGLDDITPVAGGGLRIGANVTLARLAADARVRARYGALAEAAGVSASPQIRNVATIGGNLLQRPRCWYFRSRAHHCARKGGDTCFAFAGENQHHAIFDHNGCAIVHPSTSATALVAFGAALELAAPDGRRRRLALEDFLLLPEVDITRENKLAAGEVLTAVLLPALPATTRSVHLKEGMTESFDWPLADVAVVLDMQDDGTCRRAAVVLGAAAPVPHRAPGAETLLAGKPVDERTAHAAARAALHGARPLTKNAYKLPLFETLVRRALLAAARAAKTAPASQAEG